MRKKDVLSVLNECFVVRMVFPLRLGCVIQDSTAHVDNPQAFHPTMFAWLDIFAHLGALNQFVVLLAPIKIKAVRANASIVP